MGSLRTGGSGRRRALLPAFQGRAREIRLLFQAFARETTPSARAWLMACGVPEEDAEDIVQSALLALWERWTRVPPRAWPRWLRSALVLRRTELLRHREIRQKHAPRAAWEQELESAQAITGAEVGVIRAEEAAIAREHLAALRPEQQAIVRAYLLEERTMEEAATTLGIALPTAWDRWGRAKRALLERMARLRERERFMLRSTGR